MDWVSSFPFNFMKNENFRFFQICQTRTAANFLWQIVLVGGNKRKIKWKSIKNLSLHKVWKEIESHQHRYLSAEICKSKHIFSSVDKNSVMCQSCVISFLPWQENTCDNPKYVVFERAKGYISSQIRSIPVQKCVILNWKIQSSDDLTLLKDPFER